MIISVYKIKEVVCIVAFSGRSCCTGYGAAGERVFEKESTEREGDPLGDKTINDLVLILSH